MDRAPYHLGALLQLNSCTKDEMAEVLRALGRKGIKVNLHAKDGEGNDLHMNYELPKEGYTWPRGAPSRKWFPRTYSRFCVAYKTSLPIYIFRRNSTA